MSNPRKRKGTRVENEIVDLHHEAGFAAKRMPLSGSLGGEYAGDLRVLDLLPAEVKARKSGTGFKTLEKWLGKNKLLFLKRDRQTPMVVIPWDVYVHLVKLDSSRVAHSQPPDVSALPSL